jgi:membrane protein insertase Oxa1/YidC/SpoIIIJ
VLSIGTILLQQVISMRSQKEQQKYSSVDGQGATQQKTMLVVMTIMFAVFSFMYSSAFSIYMIMSNVLSLFSTLLINKIVDTVEAKKEEKALLKKYDNKRTYKEDDKKSGKKGK